MKRRRIVAFLLALMLILQMTPPATAMAYPAPEFGAQDSVAKFENGTPVSVAHRAAWRSGPENSLLAIAASIQMGVDVAELDVKLTSDGVAVLSHDESIDRCTTGSGSISDYTWEELKGIPLEPEEGGSNTPYVLSEAEAQLLNSLPHYAEHNGAAAAGGTLPITRLDDAVDLIKQLGPNTMINLDHCFSQERFVACYILFRETGMLNQVFFKNSVDSAAMNSWYEAAAAAWNEKHPDSPIDAGEVQRSILYVYIIRNADYSVLQSHLDNGDNLVMVEICISDDNMDAQIHDNLEPWCKEHDVAMFVNTMWSGLCSTKADTETTWAEMLDRGYAAIQTDRPSELAEYLAAYNSTREAKGVIEAEHFHLFNYDDYGLYVAAASDDALNKKVENMESGDYLEYRNLTFDGTESMVNFQMKSLAGGELSVYLDSMTSENRIAQIYLSPSADYQMVSAAIETAVPAGTHTVYLQVSGAADTALLSIDHFRFVNASDYLEGAVISDIYVETQVGTAPALPGSVEAVAGDETYGLEVRWEQIPEENYAKEGQFVVLGYVPALKTYIKATVSVIDESAITPVIPEENLVLWLDASEGVTQENGVVSEWASKVGDITATLKTGSPTVTDSAAGGNAGIYFDGSDAMDLVMPDNFWNEKDEFTVLMYVSSENTTSGASNGTQSQYHSVMYFGETADWGSAYFNASQNEVIWRFGSGTNGDYGTTYERELSVGSMYTGTAIRKDGTSDAMFINGEKIYTGTAASGSTKNISSAGWIGLGKNNTYFTGTICEILIYDAALTDEQIEAAQKALAEKYADEITDREAVEVYCEAGSAPTLPAAVTVTWESGHTADLGAAWESIDPNNYLNEGSFTVNGVLANGDAVTAQVTVTAASEQGQVTTDGMVFWLNSSEGITTDESGVITEWKSKVGDYSAVYKKGNAKIEENAVNEKTAVAFDGDEDVLQMDLEGDRLNGLTGVTVVVYAASGTPWEYDSKKNFDWNVQRRTLFYTDEDGSWGSFYAGIYSDAVSARFGTGASNDAGYRQERTEETTDYTATAIRWDGSLNSYDVDVNGEDFGTGNSLTGTTGNNKDTIYFGTGKSNTYWTGKVCEIMVYDRVLSDAELNRIYEYLEEMYEPRDTTVTTDEMLFWLDASEGVVTDENGVISEWKSKVGDYTAARKKGNAVLEENAVNGKPAAAFDGSEDVLQMVLEEGRLNGLTGVTVVVYAASETPWEYDSSRSFDWNVQRRTLFYTDEDGSWGSFYAGIYSDAVSARFGTGVNQDAGYRQERAQATTDYTTTAIRWDGANNAYDVDVNGEDFGTGNSLAETTDHNKNIIYFGTGKDNSYWTGKVCEILVYDRVLSDGEVESIYNYLEDKYGKEPETIDVTGIYLKEQGQQLTLHRGDIRELTASTVPANADNRGLIYSSSNPEVAAVDENGAVTAVGFGYAVITAATEDGGFQAYCSVFVDRTDAEKIWQNIQDLVAWVSEQDGDSYSNWEDMQKALELAETVSESSSKEELAAVYNALRTAMLNLLEAVDYQIDGESADQTLEIGKPLTVIVIPDSEYLVSIQVDGNTVSTDDYEAVKGDSGLTITLDGEYLAGISAGQHRLKIIFANGEAETSFTLIRAVTGIRLTQTTAEMETGDTLQLTAAVEPCDATNTKVTFASSDADVVTVDETGKVTAVGAGTATVSATTEDGGYTASCQITVSDKALEGCRHEDTWIVGKKNATCTEDGYTGDVTCKSCGQIVQKGHTVSKTGHHYTNGVCSACGAREQGTSGSSGQSTPTGDNNPLGVLIGAIAISSAALAYLYVRKNRSRGL